MTTLDHPTRATSAPPRAHGAVRLTIGRDSRLKTLRQSASLKALFPRVDGTATHAVLVNTAGGATGGDRFSVDAATCDGGHLVMTTQAAERAYEAQPGETAKIRTQLTVGAGSRLDWLPQEMLLFDRSAIDRRLQVTLETGAELTLVETLVFGRLAMGERVRQIRLRDRIQIMRDDRPLFLDQMSLNGNADDALSRPWRGSGHAALSLLVVVSPRAEALLDPIRDFLSPSAGASLRAPDMLVARILASDSFALRQSLVPILRRVCGDVPKPWKI